MKREELATHHISCEQWITRSGSPRALMVVSCQLRRRRWPLLLLPLVEPWFKQVSTHPSASRGHTSLYTSNQLSKTLDRLFKHKLPCGYRQRSQPELVKIISFLCKWLQLICQVRLRVRVRVSTFLLESSIGSTFKSIKTNSSSSI